jgi:ribosome maturation factor RimP
LDKAALIKDLKELISLRLGQENLELVDLFFNQEGRKLILRILVDKPAGNGLASTSQSHKPEGGITLGQCALLNRQLGVLLEEKNIIAGDYILEVSSPGLDRRLSTQKDFLRCLNKEVVFFLNDLVNGKCQWQGLVSKVDERSVFIQNSGQILEIPLVKINKAQLVI